MFCRERASACLLRKGRKGCVAPGLAPRSPGSFPGLATVPGNDLPVLLLAHLCLSGACLGRSHHRRGRGEVPPDVGGSRQRGWESLTRQDWPLPSAPTAVSRALGRQAPSQATKQLWDQHAPPKNGRKGFSKRMNKPRLFLRATGNIIQHFPHNKAVTFILSVTETTQGQKYHVSNHVYNAGKMERGVSHKGACQE